MALANDALFETRRQLTSLLTALHGLFYRCELQAPWRMSFVSNGVQELTGHPQIALEHELRWADLIHPDDLPPLEKAVAAGVEARTPFVAEYRIFHASGEIRWVRERGHAVYGDGGEPLFLEGIIVDATEQKQLELSLAATLQAQKASARHWQSVLDAIPQMVWTSGPEEEEYYNARWIEFTGYRGFDFDRSDMVHPLDRDRAMATWEAAKASCQPYQCEYRLRHRSGAYRWILSRGHPQRDEQGNVVEWYGTCTDIHERVLAQQAMHESEARFRSILDSLPQKVWSMPGGALKPDYYNRRWYEFTGLPPGSTGGSEWAELYHPEDFPRIKEKWRASCRSGEAYQCEYRLRRTDGEYRWVLSEGRAERGPGGEILRWYGTCTDVHEEVVAREAVRSSERRLKTTLDMIPQIIWAADGDGNIDFLSAQSRGFFGDALPASGRDWTEVVHPDDRSRAAWLWKKSVAAGEPYETEFRVRRDTGEWVWTLVRAVPERDDQGRVIRWFGTCTDIDARVRALNALHESEALSRGIIEASPDCIKLLDLDGRVLFINDAGCRALELAEPADLLGKHWPSSLEAEAREAAEAAIAAAKGGALGHLTALHPTLSGVPKWWDIVASPIPGENGEPTKLLVISRDITHQKEAEEQVAWSANHDSLTSLANRALLQARIEQSLAECEQAGGQFALLLLDVDDFKRVNDTLGHDAGDKLLCTFAERLKAAARGDDVVARLGGDEFAILLAGVGSAEAVSAAVHGLYERLREPCLYGGRMLDCNASVGASIFPLHGSDRATLLKSADIALYAAKGSGRGHFKLFEPKMRREMQLRASMLNLAKDALVKRRIVPFYQPKVDLRTGQIAGFEALLRWNHPTRGVQLPATVAAAFEDMNLAAQISDEIIVQVIEDMRRWLDEGIRFGHVAINAAAAEFRRGNFAEQLLQRLERARIPSSCVQLEVTETVFLGRGAEYVERALKTLSKAGVQIALDDFGTGYASLSHLKQFPVDLIKIDRSFVRDFDRFPDDAAIIKAVIGLGNSLGIKVIAEGIETPAHHRFLLGAGCEFGQGFLYARAAPAAEVPQLLSQTCHPSLAA